ncbi:MAG: DNA methyltransferase [Moorellaceae bacterium]
MPWNLRQADDPSAPGSGGMFTASGRRTLTITAPATEEAKQWEGWGTSLKPSVEIWVLARKPLSEGNVAENVLKWGTGAININGCRIPTGGQNTFREVRTPRFSGDTYSGGKVYDPRAQDGTWCGGGHPLGRWPANLVLSHIEECVFRGYKRVKGSGTSKTFHSPYDGVSATGFPRGWSHPGNQHAGPDGTELAEDWVCAPDCPVRLLDGQSGELKSGFMRAGTVRSNLCGYRGAMPAVVLHDTYGDRGGASRFFYCAKVSRSERWGWCRDCGRVLPPGELAGHRTQGHSAVIHPTQKPLQLMRWLIRLVTPPGGLVLDPFAGSGTTLVAALLEGFGCVGVEREKEYAAIAAGRLKAAAGADGGNPAPDAGAGAGICVPGGGAVQLTLFP